jgi:hypothetical protein
MDEKTLTRLLRAEATEADQPGRSCPDEALLSAYVDHGISDEKREKVEAHLADCDVCLGQVAVLASQPADLAAPVVPGAVARARDLVGLPPSPWRPLILRWGTALACVAGVAVAAALVLRTPQAPPTAPAPDAATAVPAQPAAEPAGPPAVTAPQVESRTPKAEPTTASPSPRTVRRSTSAALTLAVLFPADNATLVRQDLEFRWQPVPGSVYYEINVVTDDGTVVWHTRVEGTSTRLPDGTKLDTGAKYFIWVKAFLTGGETVRSAAVAFHIAGQ